jgi:Tfp pilus tip-associated adhesin PilY1
VDPLTAGTAYTDLRGSLRPLTMTQSGSGSSAVRTIACVGTTAQCNASTGWRVDLPDSGERVNVHMKLQLGTLVVASNVPQNSACTIGGYSWLNYLNYATGMAVANSTGLRVSQRLSDSLAVGLNIVRLPDGRTVVITTTSDAKQTTVGAPFDTPSPTGKRISWREISQ